MSTRRSVAAEGGERLDRVVRQADVAREVVARPERDAGERQVALDGDAGDGPEGAVAARHAECVGVAGRARELLEVVVALEHAYMHAPRPRRLDELVRSSPRRSGG